MKEEYTYDVIIIGGSYAGLAAGMALGRAMKNVLIIDSGNPCNRNTPYSHNFITQDGKAPGEITQLARQQLKVYDTVRIFNGRATTGVNIGRGFEILCAAGEKFSAKKLIFATGIKDLLPRIEGFAECWGKSVLHCPYCHGYEVRNKKTVLLGNGDSGYEFTVLLSNWTKDLALLSNGKSTLTDKQQDKLALRSITIKEEEIEKLEHYAGQLHTIRFKDGTGIPAEVMYAPLPFEQHCSIPQSLGCELSQEGYIRTDHLQRTSVYGVYACGDNSNRMRTLANAVATGTTAGMMLNKELVLEEF
jgi:thioredoxin reductase